MRLGDRWGDDPTLTNSYDWASAFDNSAPGIVEVARAIQTAGESFVDAVNRARLQVAMTDYQAAMLDLNLQRARAGQAPISASQYSGGGSSIDTRTVWIGLLAIGALLLAKS